MMCEVQRIGKRGSLDFPWIGSLRATASPYGITMWIRKRHPFSKTLYCHLLETLSLCRDFVKTRQSVSQKSIVNQQINDMFSSRWCFLGLCSPQPAHLCWWPWFTAYPWWASGNAYFLVWLQFFLNLTYPSASHSTPIHLIWFHYGGTEREESGRVEINTHK